MDGQGTEIILRQSGILNKPLILWGKNEGQGTKMAAGRSASAQCTPPQAVFSENQRSSAS